MAWKDEAFALWLSVWAVVYHEESQASELLHTIHDTYFLVSVVDNDVLQGNIWNIFESLKEEENIISLQ